MYQFTSRAELSLNLHDEDGRRIGKVKFAGGRYATDSAEEAAAIERAARAATEHRITCVSRPALAAPAEQAPAVASLPAEAPRRSRPTKGHKHNG